MARISKVVVVIAALSTDVFRNIIVATRTRGYCDGLLLLDVRYADSHWLRGGWPIDVNSHDAVYGDGSRWCEKASLKPFALTDMVTSRRTVTW
jgi:hypothetical protein